jgi:hypothetical protein
MIFRAEVGGCEGAIALAWKGILSELSGHSLMAGQIISRIRGIFVPSWPDSGNLTICTREYMSAQHPAVLLAGDLSRRTSRTTVITRVKRQHY